MLKRLTVINMTDEQAEQLQRDFYDFIEETRDNFAKLFKDRETDAETLRKIYTALGLVRNEVQTQTDRVEEATDKMEKAVDKVEEQSVAVSEDLNKVGDILEHKESKLIIIEKGLTLRGFFRMLFKRDNNVKNDTDK